MKNIQLLGRTKTAKNSEKLYYNTIRLLCITYIILLINGGKKKPDEHFTPKTVTRS